MAKLACDPEFQGVTGAYFSITERTNSSPASLEEARQAEMWEYSQALVARLCAAGDGTVQAGTDAGVQPAAPMGSTA